jgi:prepilin-type N-terminal cleavage/methylation domain-containing protein
MKRGFSLVELLVALALFGFIVVIASGTLIVLSNSSTSAQISRKTIDNIDFILDDIVREARLGKNYHCVISLTADYDNDKVPADCSKGSNSFAITEIGTGYLIRYSTTTVAGKSVVVKEVISKNSSGSYVASSTQLSATDIDISSIRFYVSGSQTGDSVPAQVLITLQAELKKGSRFSSKVNLQTTVTQRANDD